MKKQLYVLKFPVEAIQFKIDASNWREVCFFIGDETDYDSPFWKEDIKTNPTTLNVDWVKMYPGQWVIKMRIKKDYHYSIIDNDKFITMFKLTD